MTVNSALSFQGLSSGLQTDALVSAILSQEGKTVEGLQARQTRNQQKTVALNSMRTSMNTLSISLATFQDKLNSRIVTSTDVNNTNVTATATGATNGSYDLTVTTTATKGRISPTLDPVTKAPTNLAVVNPADAIFTGLKATFAVRGTDGVIKAFDVTNNSLNGLRDAINAQGAGVLASIINTGAGANPYQLVITAKDTGTGTTSGIVTLADVTDNTPAGLAVNSLGITHGTVDDLVTPTTLSGGFTSAESGIVSDATGIAKDAVFTLNGIQLTRKTNVVTDAADGITFTLKQGGQTGTTTLTVAQDKTTATNGMQDVLTKFNALVKIYKDASASTQDKNGTILQGPLTGDGTARSIISQIRSALTGASAGLPLTSTYQIPAGLGIKTNSDGTLTMDTTIFQAAIDKDSPAAMRLFTLSGSSNNGVLAFQGGSANTVTGAVGFTTSYAVGGAVSGTFTGTSGGIPFSIGLTGTNGTLIGGPGTPLEGLTMAVTASGSGTLTISRGAGKAVQDLITKLTASGTGALTAELTGITSQNSTIAEQIDRGQSALDRRKIVLQAQFSKMEVAIAQMKASSGSLSSA